MSSHLNGLRSGFDKKKETKSEKRRLPLLEHLHVHTLLRLHEVRRHPSSHSGSILTSQTHLSLRAL